MGVIHKGLSSKTATQESQVHNHVVSCYSHFFTDLILHPVRCLYRSPYLQFISLVMCNTIQWLHTIMRLIRSLINHVNLLFCILYYAVRVSLFAERKSFTCLQSFFLAPEYLCCI